MKCPHCMDNFHDNEQFRYIEKDPDGAWCVSFQRCSACRRLVVFLLQGGDWVNPGKLNSVSSQRLVRPRGSARAPCPPSVTPNIAEDYSEACIVLPDSAKASAALSRRCLQHVLREKGGVKAGNLADEIQQIIDSGSLPSHLCDSIDAIRNIGNFAAHPMKSSSTGQILPVEPHEAEWNLDVLESLFDFYFVQPALLNAKRNALNQKLAAAGKPKMK